VRTNQALAGGARVQSALESWIGCLGSFFWTLDFGQKYVSGVTGIDQLKSEGYFSVESDGGISKDGVWIRASQANWKKVEVD